MDAIDSPGHDPDDPDDAATREGIRRRQWAELIRRLPTTLGGQLVAGIAWIALARNAVDPLLLTTWVSLLLLSMVSIPLLYWRHRDLSSWRLGWPALIPWYAGCILVHGLIWGVGLALILPVAPVLELQSLVLLLALLVGAPLSVSSHFTTMALFGVSLILPMGIRFMLHSSPDMRVLGYACIPCLVTYCHAAWLLNSHLLRSYRALHRNRVLVQALHDESVVMRQLRLQAEQASLDKSRFLAAASHDLRQPIHAIGLFVAALRRESLPPVREQIMDRLSGAMWRMDDLFNRLFDIARMDAGKVEPVIRAFAARGLLQDLTSQFAPLAQERGLTLRVFAPAGLFVRGDQQLLERMLGNLLANAIRYTDHGGVLVSARPRGNRVLLQVWDTGIGIAPQSIERVFDEFVQLDPLTAQRHRGLGLGLAIVKRLSRLLDARIAVRSAPRRGSVFELSVERARAATPALPRDDLPTSANLSLLAGVSVLVVDDKADVIDATRLILESLDCYVLQAMSVTQVRQALESSDRMPDIVVTDLRLHGAETGWQAIDAVTDILGDNFGTLIVSGELSPQEQERARSAGHLYLKKPVDLQRLLPSLLDALNLASSRQSAP